MAMTLKVDMGGDVRRFRFELPEGYDMAWMWQRILHQVRRGYDLPEDSGLTLKYRDDEGDLCTLIQETLPDCLAQAGNGPLKLLASVPSAAAPAGEWDPARLLEAIDQVAKDPEKMLEVVGLMQRDPAKLFGIMRAFKAAKWGLIKKAWNGQAEPAGPGPQAEWAPEEYWEWNSADCLAWKGKGKCKGKGKWKGAAWKHHDTPWKHHEGAWKGNERAAAEHPEEANPGKKSISGDEWDLCSCPRPGEDSAPEPPAKEEEAKEAPTGEEATSASEDAAGSRPAGPVPQAEGPPEDPLTTLMEGLASAFAGKGKGKGKGKWGKGHAFDYGFGAPHASPQPAQPAFGGGQQAQAFGAEAFWQGIAQQQAAFTAYSQAANRAAAAQQQAVWARIAEQWAPMAQQWGEHLGQVQQATAAAQQGAVAQPPATSADGSADAAPYYFQ